MKSMHWIVTLGVLLGIPRPAGAEFLTGFNQGWFQSAQGVSFGCTWVSHQTKRPLCFEEKSAVEMLRATRRFGGRVLRMWLFEGVENDALIWEGATPRLQSTVLPNIRRFLELARERNVLIYWNLLADISARTLKGQPRETRNRWWNILNGHYGAREKFLKGAVAPLLPLFDEFREQIYGIDVFNEIDGAILGYAFDTHDGAKGWAKANQLVCDVRGYIRANTSQPPPVTASFGWPWIPFRYPGAPQMIGSQPHTSCVDFYDFHHYGRKGGVPNCRAIKELSESKPVVLGEFGQTGRFVWVREPETPDLLDPSGFERAQSIETTLRQAKSCGISAAFAWRLKEVDELGRAIHNSYLGSGKAQRNGEAWDVSVFRRVSRELR